MGYPRAFLIESYLGLWHQEEAHPPYQSRIHSGASDFELINWRLMVRYVAVLNDRFPPPFFRKEKGLLLPLGQVIV